jgi:hypothetical protein
VRWVCDFSSLPSLFFFLIWLAFDMHGGQVAKKSSQVARVKCGKKWFAWVTIVKKVYMWHKVFKWINMIGVCVGG